MLAYFIFQQSLLTNLSSMKSTTIIEEHYPPKKRQNASNFTNLMKTTLAQSFLKLLEEPKLVQRPSAKESQQIIMSHFSKINSIIDNVDDHICRRMENHQNEVFSIVKGQIDQMRQQTKLIIVKLNEAINKKNTQDQIWKLNNELDYFKAQTYKLFEENKKVRSQMKQLQTTIKEYQIQLENSDRLMQKLKKNCMKEKIIKEKISKSIQEKISSLGKEKVIDIQTINEIFQIHSKDKQSKKVKTQIQQTKQLPLFSNFMQSKVEINLGSGKKSKRIMITVPDQIQKNSGQFSIPSLSMLEEIDMSQLPAPKITRADSFMMNQSTKKYDSKASKYVQTEAEKPFFQVNEAVAQRQKQFSKTGYLQREENGKHGKKLDLIKNGFYVRSYNQRISRAQSYGIQKQPQLHVKQNRHSRYMSKALSKNKIKVQSSQVRGITNKSCMK